MLLSTFCMLFIHRLDDLQPTPAQFIERLEFKGKVQKILWKLITQRILTAIDVVSDNETSTEMMDVEDRQQLSINPLWGFYLYM